MTQLKSLVLLLLCYAIFTTPVLADRYKGNTADRPPLDNLVAVLKAQAGELERLIKMRTELNNGKQALADQDSRIRKDENNLTADRKKLADAKITQQKFDEIWKHSGELERHSQLKKEFQSNIEMFNKRVGDFNVLVKNLKRALEGRNPDQLDVMIKNMRDLIAKLQKFLGEGEIEKAKFVAKKSKLAEIFGYVPQ